MFNTSHRKGQSPNPMNVLRNRFPELVEQIADWPAGDLFTPAAG